MHWQQVLPEPRIPVERYAKPLMQNTLHNTQVKTTSAEVYDDAQYAPHFPSRLSLSGPSISQYTDMNWAATMGYSGARTDTSNFSNGVREDDHDPDFLHLSASLLADLAPTYGMWEK